MLVRVLVLVLENVLPADFAIIVIGFQDPALVAETEFLAELEVDIVEIGHVLLFLLFGNI